MAEEPYKNYEIRSRIESVNERVVKLEGKHEGHELICAQRQLQVLREFAELRAIITMIAKVGLFIAFVLFALELGRATFPVIFDLLTKGH